MSWTDHFNSCMSNSGLPTPSQLFDSAEQALEILHELKDAYDAAGGGEITLQDLQTAAIAAGVSAAALEILADIVAVAATATAVTYLAACASCVLSATWDTAIDAAKEAVKALFSQAGDPWLHDQLVAQAEKQGVPQDAIA